LKKLVKEAKSSGGDHVKTPFEDFPLNKTLINIPIYSEFINEHRALLIKAKTYFKKCLTFV